MAEREVLIFDLYGTLVDPIAISVELGQRYGADTGRVLANLWRSRQVEYAFRLTIMDKYHDFKWITIRALDDSLAELGLRPDQVDRDELVERYDHLSPFTDALAGLVSLRAAGHVLAVLSNGSPKMIENCLINSGLMNYISTWTSVDEVRAFKPSPRVYHHVATKLQRMIGDVRLVSSNPFDVIGASAVGMRTTWINRTGSVFDSIGNPPDQIVQSIEELSDLIVA